MDKFKPKFNSGDTVKILKHRKLRGAKKNFIGEMGIVYPIYEERNNSDALKYYQVKVEFDGDIYELECKSTDLEIV
jgi:hypothetical protein